MRNQTVTVEYSPHKTLGLQIYHSIISKKFIITFGGYFISSIIFGSIFLSQLSLLNEFSTILKEYQQKPKINDQWVFFWFYVVFTSLIYSFQQLIFQRNRLQFTYGVSKIDPKQGLLAKLPQLLGNSIMLNILTTVSSPIVYYFVRNIIYKMNWLVLLIIGLDTKAPSFNVGFKNWINLGYYSFNIYLNWEIINHIYNVYATIGCLDGTKPISTYSSDPINTLLSGLRNNEPDQQLSKLTAFQELAYMAMLKGPEGNKIRMSIYNAHSKGGFIWSSILDECSIVIKEVNQRINYRPSYETAKVEPTVDKDIFGNSFISTPKVDESAIKSYDELTNKTTTKPIANKTLQKYYEMAQNSIIKPINSYLKDLNDPRINSSKVKVYINNTISLYNTYKNHFLSTSIGIFFRTSLKRDTESRVLNPVNYGNAVISLTNLLIHAIEEDKNLTVSNSHISDCLNLLERPIRSCENYVESLPPSVFLTLDQKKANIVNSNHVIKLLHDLTLVEFKKICISYNYKLNDLLLSSRSFKLAKRVIDEEIATRSQ